MSSEKVIGTFHNVTENEVVEMYVKLGVSKETGSRLIGSHWSMKLWKDEDLIGIYCTCREHPRLNILETFSEGVEKSIDHPLVGGKAKVLVKKLASGNGVLIVYDSELLGHVKLELKTSVEGLEFTHSSKNNRVVEKWDRHVKLSGSYVFEKGENVEAFLRAISKPDMGSSLKDYKMHLIMKGEKMGTLTESFGALGVFTNELELDVEKRFSTVGDVKGELPKHRAIVTRVGMGRYSMLSKNDKGITEHWVLDFTDSGIKMSASTNASNVTCKMIMRRFSEPLGTFHLVSMVGLENFVNKMGCGISADLAHEMSKDISTKMIISDEGKGSLRLRMMRRHLPVDYTFRMNEEFSYRHPILNEDVKVTPSMVDDATMMLKTRTSKGMILVKLHLNPVFVVMSVTMPGPNLRYKYIFERTSFEF